MAVSVKGSGGKIIKENPNVKTFYSSDYPSNGQSQQADMSLTSQEIVAQNINVVNNNYTKIFYSDPGYYIYLYPTYLYIISYSNVLNEYGKTWTVNLPKELNNITSIIVKGGGTILMADEDWYNNYYSVDYGMGGTESETIYGIKIWRGELSSGNWSLVGWYGAKGVGGSRNNPNTSSDINMIDMNGSNTIAIVVNSKRDFYDNIQDDDDSSFALYICDIYQGLEIPSDDPYFKDGELKLEYFPKNKYFTHYSDSDSYPMSLTDYLIINNNKYYFSSIDSSSVNQKYNQIKIYDMGTDEITTLSSVNSIINNIKILGYYIMNNNIVKLQQDLNNNLLQIINIQSNTVLMNKQLPSSIIDLIPISYCDGGKKIILNSIIYTTEEDIYLIDLKMDKIINISSLDIDITKFITLFHQYTNATYNPYQNIISYLLYQNSDGVQKKAMYCQNLLLSD